MLLSCDADTFDFGTFVSKARSVLHRRLQHPPLAMSFFQGGIPIAEDQMWEDLGYPSRVQILLTTTHNNLWDKLAHAILHNSIDEVEWLLWQGQDPNGTYAAGTTLLVYACQAGALGGMKTLLQSKASPNLVGSDGLGPLHSAATRRHYSAAELLLVYGADPNKPNSFGDAAVHLAAQDNNSDMVALFMGCGADQTCPGLPRRLSITGKQPDVCGGSDACNHLMFGWQKLFFQLAKGPKFRRVGLVLDGPAHAGCRVMSNPHRQPMGVVCSSSWSPKLQCRVAQAYVKPEYAKANKHVLITVPYNLPMHKMRVKAIKRHVRSGPLRSAYRRLVAGVVAPLPFVAHGYPEPERQRKAAARLRNFEETKHFSRATQMPPGGKLVTRPQSRSTGEELQEGYEHAAGAEILQASGPAISDLMPGLRKTRASKKKNTLTEVKAIRRPSSAFTITTEETLAAGHLLMLLKARKQRDALAGTKLTPFPLKALNQAFGADDM
eukprot:s3035_g2.t1